jgi:hypothetical protein
MARFQKQILNQNKPRLKFDPAGQKATPSPTFQNCWAGFPCIATGDALR